MGEVALRRNPKTVNSIAAEIIYLSLKDQVTDLSDFSKQIQTGRIAPGSFNALQATSTWRQNNSDEVNFEQGEVLQKIEEVLKWMGSTRNETAVVNLITEYMKVLSQAKLAPRHQSSTWPAVEVSPDQLGELGSNLPAVGTNKKPKTFQATSEEIQRGVDGTGNLGDDNAEATLLSAEAQARKNEEEELPERAMEGEGGKALAAEPNFATPVDEDVVPPAAPAIDDSMVDALKEAAEAKGLATAHEAQLTKMDENNNELKQQLREQAAATERMQASQQALLMNVLQKQELAGEKVPGQFQAELQRLQGELSASQAGAKEKQEIMEAAFNGELKDLRGRFVQEAAIRESQERQTKKELTDKLDESVRIRDLKELQANALKDNESFTDLKLKRMEDKLNTETDKSAILKGSQNEKLVAAIEKEARKGNDDLIAAVAEMKAERDDLKKEDEKRVDDERQFGDLKSELKDFKEKAALDVLKVKQALDVEQRVRSEMADLEREKQKAQGRFDQSAVTKADLQISQLQGQLQQAQNIMGGGQGQPTEFGAGPSFLQMARAGSHLLQKSPKDIHQLRRSQRKKKGKGAESDEDTDEDKPKKKTKRKVKTKVPQIKELQKLVKTKVGSRKLKRKTVPAIGF